jgi:hypothetical protein
MLRDRAVGDARPVTTEQRVLGDVVDNHFHKERNEMRRIFFVLLVAVLAVTCAASGALAWDGTSSKGWGAGLGIPYGGVGVNYEAGAQTRLSVGLGWMENLGWNVGVKHYFGQPPAAKKGSASISVYYGTVGILRRINLNSGSESDETLQGFSVAVGWTAGHFDIGLIKPFFSIPEGAEEVGPSVKLYVGYRF